MATDDRGPVGTVARPLSVVAALVRLGAIGTVMLMAAAAFAAAADSAP